MDAERILRNVALAYIGAVAFAYEKTKDAVDFCIEKGAKTVEGLRPRGEELVGKIKQTVENKAYGRDAKINVMLSLMNEQERELMKSKLNGCDCGCCEDDCGDACQDGGCACTD